jgi:hypothetical protein
MKPCQKYFGILTGNSPTLPAENAAFKKMFHVKQWGLVPALWSKRNIEYRPEESYLALLGHTITQMIDRTMPFL